MITQILQKIQELQSWLFVSTKISINISYPPFVKEGQIWWAHIGENIGSEINGKSENFTRPVIIFTKLSKYTFLVIPCSTKIKEGSWFVKFRHNSMEQVAVLSQIRIIDGSRLKQFIGDIDQKDFADITTGFKNLYIK
jgi:mRNA interferase MazF